MWLKQNILEKIKKEKIIPISRFQIMRKYLFIGIFLSLFVSFGIFTVSFFISDALEIAELIELDTISVWVAWILLIVIVWIIAYIDMRDIGKIYKYGIWKILSFIFITMILWWSIVYFTGIGKEIQGYLMRHTNYEKLMIVYTNWNNPESGRLIGEIVQIKWWYVFIRNIEEVIWKVKITRNMYDTLNSHGERIFKNGNTLKFTGKLIWTKEFEAESATLIFQ